MKVISKQFKINSLEVKPNKSQFVIYEMKKQNLVKLKKLSRNRRSKQLISLSITIDLFAPLNFKLQYHL